jgi:hypothetical protein
MKRIAVAVSLAAVALIVTACSSTAKQEAAGRARSAAVPAATQLDGQPSAGLGSSPPAAGGATSSAGNPYAANASVGNPAADPGPDPVFASDTTLRMAETYTYRFTRPGDHTLPAGTVALQYDVGTNALRSVLSQNSAQLAKATGIALYLTGGTALSDTDLADLQRLGLTNLYRLHIYNLKTLQGGRECTPASGLACAGQQARGGRSPYLWLNGWWDTWVRELVLDDLTAVKDGTFSNHNFSSVSLKAAETIGVMAFGHGPYAKLSVLYLPSVTTIAHDAFRRNQYLLKVNLPRATRVDDFAFDDASRLQYFNAPKLAWIGRNALNDSHALISVNLPRLEYMGINCFDLNGALKILRLPALTNLDKNAITGFGVLQRIYAPSLLTAWHNSITNNGGLQAIYLPKVTWFGPGAVRNNPKLTQVILGGTPPRQDADVFLDSNAATIYHTGTAAAWANFVPSGNPRLPVRAR